MNQENKQNVPTVVSSIQDDRQREKHTIYMRTWRKTDTWKKYHKEYQSRWAKTDKGKMVAKRNALNYYKMNGTTRNLMENRKSQKNATFSRQPWGPVEDALLESEKTTRELATLLGRSLRSIERRRWRLRQEA